MSAISGYPSSQKVPLGTGITSNFASVIPTDPYRNAVDTPRFAFRVGSETVVRTAGASTGVERSDDGSNLFWVYDTATPAKPGDFARFETGTAQSIEIPIVKSETDRFLLAINSGLLPAPSDTFYILRYATQRVDSTGAQYASITPSAVSFTKDGVLTPVLEDTATPANDIPLPVKIFDSTGAVAKLPSALGQATMANSLPVAIASNQSPINVLTGVVPFQYDEMVITYVGAGNGIGQIYQVVYKLATATVATLTLTYDSNDKLVGVVRT